VRLLLELRPDVTHLRPARRVGEGWAEAHGLPAEALKLIATELLANAIAASGGTDPVELTLDIDHEDVTLTVTDAGPCGFDPAQLPEAGVTTAGGRGLLIVRALSNRIDVERRGGRTRVSAHQYWRPLYPLGPAPSGPTRASGWRAASH
jgi:anti-sigma regulatory factor (Ser/Thr protein kinase)